MSSRTAEPVRRWLLAGAAVVVTTGVAWTTLLAAREAPQPEPLLPGSTGETPLEQLPRDQLARYCPPPPNPAYVGLWVAHNEECPGLGYWRYP
jgi:hypothetical protein